jgi:inosose dehydratase
VLTAARKLDVDLCAIVEQDMYPCPPDRPFPIARRTREFLRSCGVPQDGGATPAGGATSVDDVTPVDG